MKYRSGQRDAQSLQGTALMAACSNVTHCPAQVRPSAACSPPHLHASPGETGCDSAGWLYLEARDFAKADKAFEKLVSEVAKNDDYGWLGLASLTLTSIPSKRKKVQSLSGNSA